MEEKQINKKITIGVVAILLIVLITFGATYAYFSAQSQTDKQTVTTGTLGIIATMTETTQTNIKPTQFISNIYADNNDEIAKFSFDVKGDTTTVANATYDIQLLGVVTGIEEDSTNGGQLSDINYVLYKGNTEVVTGTFDQITTMRTINTGNVLTGDTNDNYILYVYIKETNNNQDNLQNVKISVTMNTIAKTWTKIIDADTTNFKEKLASAPAGGTIRLAAGDYGKLNLDIVDLEDNINIIGTNKVNFDTLTIKLDQQYDSPKNLKLEGFNFYGEGLFGDAEFNGVSVSNCNFTNGAKLKFSVLDSAGVGVANSIVKNVTVENNFFSGINKTNDSQDTPISLVNVVGTTVVKGNYVSEGEYNGIQLIGTVSGNILINNNVIYNTVNSAFRIGKILENTKINIVENTINNAIKPSTGAIARIGSDSDLPASATINFTNNTYGGAIWPNSSWSNIQGEFGINAAGEQVES